MRIAWNRLYRLVSGANPPQADEIAAWQQDTAAVLKALIGSTQGHLLRIDELRSELATIVAKVEAVGPPAFVTDLALLENRFEFQKWLKPR